MTTKKSKTLTTKTMNKEPKLQLLAEATPKIKTKKVKNALHSQQR